MGEKLEKKVSTLGVVKGLLKAARDGIFVAGLYLYFKNTGDAQTYEVLNDIVSSAKNLGGTMFVVSGAVRVLYKYFPPGSY